MNLDEALAIYLYLKDNTEAWREPGKSAKAKAWVTICRYAQESIGRELEPQKAVLLAHGDAGPE